MTIHIKQPTRGRDKGGWENQRKRHGIRIYGKGEEEKRSTKGPDERAPISLQSVIDDERPASRSNQIIFRVGKSSQKGWGGQAWKWYRKAYVLKGQGRGVSKAYGTAHRLL